MAEERFYGRVVAVDAEHAGSTLTADVAIGATVLSVVDVLDFEVDGGQVTIGGIVYDYSSADEAANTVTLATGLTTAAATDDEVAIYDADSQGIVVEYVALVLLDEQDPGDQPIEVTIQHSLVDMLQQSVRSGAAESVTLVRDGDDDFMIWQIDGKLALNVALETAKVAFDETMAQLQADLLELNEITLPGVQADLAALQTDLASLNGLFPITSTSISDGAITTPKMSANSINGDRILANSLGADKIVANSITGDRIAANTIGADKIVANSITGDRIAANTIGADKIVANSIGADRLAANAIDGKTINGVTITGSTFTTGGPFPIDISGNAVAFSSGVYLAYDGSTLALARGSSAVQLGAGVDIYGSVTFHSSISGAVTATGTVTGNRLVSGFSGSSAVTPNVWVDSAGMILKSSSSARRYKHDIEPAAIDLEAAFALEPRNFIYNADHCDSGDVQVGFIADEAHELGLDDWVEWQDGEIENFAYMRWVVALQAMVRDLNARLIASDERESDLASIVQRQQGQIEALTARLDAAGIA